MQNVCVFFSQCTEDSHRDKPELLNAVRTMMDVATYINEYKRRKDIGELMLDLTIYYVCF
jgi:hypothetical protein